jgi:hypothetical protein
MEKITITKLAAYTTDKAGAQLKTQDGRPYTRLNIKTSEYGDKWLSGFGDPWNATWKEGDVVDVEITKKPGKDKEGNVVEYVNFSRPDPMSEITKAVMGITKDIIDLKRRVATLEAKPATIVRSGGIDFPIIQDREPVGFDESGAPMFEEPEL